MPQVLAFKIAGVFKYPLGKPVLNGMKEGDALIAQREPTNAYDPNAIAIYGKQSGVEFENDPPVKLGYVPAALALSLRDKDIKSCKRGNAFDACIIEF
jgi:HIRAN domain